MPSLLEMMPGILFVATDCSIVLFGNFEPSIAIGSFDTDPLLLL
jgi:hypothetical protein